MPLGLIQAVRRNRAVDYLATGVSFVLYSMPSYLLGLLLIAAFAVNLHLLPAEAPQASGIGGLLSIATLVGLSLPGILTFGLIIESLFNFPGVGLQYYNAAVNGDNPVEFGITVLVGVVTVVGNLLADVAYAVLDPRVRYE
ncbi:MAG: ABC transporter permease subunit [Acidimicrobiales bacterium]